MPLNEWSNSLFEEVVGKCRVRVGVNGLQDGVCTKVCEEDEAVLLVPVEDFGDVQACFFHEVGDAHKGFSIFLVGRGVHNDIGGMARVL